MLEIIKEIKNKKELKDLDDNFIKRIIKDYNLKDFKEIRRVLRKVYGMFKNLKHNRDNKVYELIFKITGKPKSVLDLGCGYAPLYFPFKNIKYYCCDIGHDYIKGKGFIFDLLHGDYNKLPKVDVVFLFKVLESLEYFKKNISKDVIKKLKSKYIVVSFDKKALGGKKEIKKKGRSWFRRILKELNLDHKIFDYGDEIFFVIKK